MSFVLLVIRENRMAEVRRGDLHHDGENRTQSPFLLCFGVMPEQYRRLYTLPTCGTGPVALGLCGFCRTC